MRFFETSRDIRIRENRPHGSLPEDNLLSEMMENIEEYIKILSDHDDVIGVTLAGGLSRGYGDNLSEIDINVYLQESKHRDWVIGRGPIPQGDHLGSKYHMDVSFLSLKAEVDEKWSLLKKWDASYAKILFDPTGIIEKLLDSKVMYTAEEKYSIALSNYLDCIYFGDIVVRQWTHRKDPIVANQMINKAISALCNLLFLANDEFPPFEKWLVNYSYSLRWKPSDWRIRLEDLTMIKALSEDEVQRRRKAFMGLYREIWERVVGEEYRNTGLLELDALETIEYVIREQPALKDFINKYNEKQLGYENLYKLADIKWVNGLERVVFNFEKFKEEQMKGFPSFLEWNREMLRHIDI